MQPRLTPSSTETSDATQTAIVVVSYGRQSLIETAQGDLLPALTRGRKLQPLCGDNVHWQSGDDASAVITSVAPRRSVLMRHDKRKNQRLLAANIDRILVTLAAEPQPDLALIDCYLLAAECLDIPASLIFNKSDLLSPEQRQAWQQRLSPYEAMGYPLYWTQASADDAGIQTLLAELRNHSSVLVGQSGVGKSSLIHALVPDHQPRTQSLSTAIGAGRHTTTATRLYHLPARSGQIIDSPGVRDFRVWHMSANEVMRGFREFRPYLGQCRFNDCLHLSEPDCAIRQALTEGYIDQRRYASYGRLLPLLTTAN